MKRLFVFLVLAAAGTVVLIHRAGGLQGEITAPDEDSRIRTRGEASPDTAMSLEELRGPPVSVGLTRASVVLAPPKAVDWQDPVTGEVVRLSNFFEWRFFADYVDQSSIRPVNAEHQSVECKNVVVDLYRLPRTLEEAKARQEQDDLGALLDKQVVARRAHAQGAMATKLHSSIPDASKGEENAPTGGVSQDTSIRLYEGVTVHDRTEGLTVQGDELTVWPAQHRLTGRGRFVVTHQSFVLTGEGLQMDRDEQGWWRLEIRKNPELRVKKAAEGSRRKLPGGLSADSLEPSRVRSDGPVVIVRKDGRRESRLHIAFPDVVHVEHADGKSLRAGTLTLVAVRPVRAAESMDWAVRDLKASKGVEIEYPERTPNGTPLLASIKADSLIHQIPRDGSPSRTELVGRPSLVIRGQLPLGFEYSDNDRLHVSCHDRAWIDAIRAVPDGVDLPLDRLRIISLRGGARLERHSKAGGSSGSVVRFSEDTIDADTMDLLVYVPKQRGKRAREAGARIADVTAVEFSARGDVRLSGTRVEGTTDAIVAKNLHTHTPHIYAEGEGAHYSFPDMQPEQRFSRGPRDNASSRAPTRPDEKPTRMKWLLHTALAEGGVEIRTDDAGPSVGIQTFTSAHRVHYDHTRGVTAVEGSAARPAHVRIDSGRGYEHQLQAQRIMMDQAAGTWVADGGVEGDLYFVDGASPTSMQKTPTSKDASLTLTVFTNKRIDLYLARKTDTWTPDLDARQRVVVQGPLRAELAGHNRVVDQLRAERVELTLRPTLGNSPTREHPRLPGRGLARASNRGRAPGPPNTTRVSNTGNKGAASTKPTHIHVKASRMTAFGHGAAIRSVEAEGRVSLKGDLGHLTGDTLDIDMIARVAHLEGGPSPSQSARARMGTAQEPADIAAKSFSLTWSKDKREPTGLTATSYKSRPSRIQFSRPVTGTSSSGRERITILYQGSIQATDTEMRFGKVKVTREALSSGNKARGRRAELRAPTLVVRGTRLLGSANRELKTITAAGEPTYFTTALKAGKAEVWAERAVYDVATGEVRLDAQNGRDVQIRIGQSTRPSRLPSITVNLVSGTTSAEGGADIAIQPR